MNNRAFLRYLNWSVVIVFAILFAYFASRLFTGTFLWYDEGGQFYIAKGLHHYSDPYSPYGGLKDVLFYNRYFNKDPGGFGILLHYWSMVSNYYVWLRLLPLLFYIGVLVVSYKMCKLLSLSTLLSVLLTSLFLIHPVFAVEACEIRGYSMEMLGAILGFYLLVKKENEWHIGSLILFALALAFFMTSRYSFIIYAFALSLYLLYSLYTQKGFGRSIGMMLPYGSILMMMVLLIGYLSVQYQFSSEGQAYVAKGYLGRNLIALLSLPCIRFYILLAILFYNKKKGIRSESYLYIALVVSVIFIAFSAFNLYPLDERRSMSLTVVQYFAIGLYAIKWLALNQKENVAKYALLIGALSLIVLYPRLNRGRLEQDAKYSEFKELLAELKSEDTVYIHRYLSPGIRYSFEEGELRGKYAKQYKKQLFFAKDGTHSPCEYLVLKNVKPEEYNATYYLLQELKPLFVIDRDKFELYNGYKHIYIKK